LRSHFGADTFVAQLLQHFAAAITSSGCTDQLVRQPLFRKPPRSLEIVEQRFDLPVGVRVRPELALELEPRMLAARQQPQCPSPQRRLLHGPARSRGSTGLGWLRRMLGAAARLARLQSSSAMTGVSSFTPAAARIFASISADMSGCSFRNSRTLSLPWPMRSLP
jgi:hypothetical protein